MKLQDRAESTALELSALQARTKRYEEREREFLDLTCAVMEVYTM